MKQYILHKNSKERSQIAFGISEGNAFNQIIEAIGLTEENMRWIHTLPIIKLCIPLGIIKLIELDISQEYICVKSNFIPNTDRKLVHMITKICYKLNHNQFDVDCTMHKMPRFEAIVATLTDSYQSLQLLEKQLMHAKRNARKIVIQNFIKQYAPDEYHKVNSIEMSFRKLKSCIKQ